MKASFRFLILLISLMTASSFLSGCALPHDPIIRITDPQNGNTFPLNQAVTLRVHVNTAVISHYNNLGDWQYYEFNIMDGGTIISHGARTTNFDEFNFPLSECAKITFHSLGWVSGKAGERMS